MYKKIRFYALFLFLIFSGCASIPKGYSPISQSNNELIYKQVDHIDNKTVYRHKNFFQAFHDSDGKMLSPIEIYIIEAYGVKFLRAEFQYTGLGWIFFDRATIVNSVGQRMVFSFNTLEKTTRVWSGSTVKESIDEFLPIDKARELSQILNNNAGEINVRLSGQYREDYTLSEKHIIGLKSMLAMYLDNK